MLLAAAGEAISPLVAMLPQRFTYSDRIKDFPTARSQAILADGKADPLALLMAPGLLTAEYLMSILPMDCVSCWMMAVSCICALRECP